MPYYVDTKEGRLEVSKGVYLTMLKKKDSNLKTLQKHKKIASHSTMKNTVKKLMPKGKLFRSRNESIMMEDKSRKKHPFLVEKDLQVFNEKFGIPVIEMDYDNDNET